MLAGGAALDDVVTRKHRDDLRTMQIQDLQKHPIPHACTVFGWEAGFLPFCDGVDGECGFGIGCDDVAAAMLLDDAGDDGLGMLIEQRLPLRV